MGNVSKTPEHIWAWWDNDYDVGMINTHGDKQYTPTEAREYVPADSIAQLEHELKQERKAYEKDIYIWQDNYASLEAKLAKAVGVIDWALICWDDHNKHGYRMQGDWVPDARTTLAQLEGYK